MDWLWLLAQCAAVYVACGYATYYLFPPVMSALDVNHDWRRSDAPWQTVRDWPLVWLLGAVVVIGGWCGKPPLDDPPGSA